MLSLQANILKEYQFRLLDPKKCSKFFQVLIFMYQFKNLIQFDNISLLLQHFVYNMETIMIFADVGIAVVYSLRVYR